MVPGPMHSTACSWVAERHGRSGTDAGDAPWRRRPAYTNWNHNRTLIHGADIACLCTIIMVHKAYDERNAP